MTITPLDQFTPDPYNANDGTERGAGMLERSLEKHGVGRSILVDKNGVVIAGNKTQQAALDLGITDAVVVETDGSQVVVVKRTDLDLLTDARARELAYFDNRTSEVSLHWNPEQMLKDMDAGIDLSGMWSDKELDALLASVPGDTEDGLGLDDEDVLFTPNAVFPSDNPYDIPTLELKFPDFVEAPMIPWGSIKRKTRFTGTLCFYTDDYRFEGLWKSPHDILETGCTAIIEPNFSCYPQTPRALVLWQIFRKRWMARYWQELGIPVIVDLNVAPNYYEDNLLGVPTGYQAFATRGYGDKLDYLEQEYALACRVSGGTPKLFVVYGGGKAVKEHCAAHGYTWFAEEMDTKATKEIQNA